MDGQAALKTNDFLWKEFDRLQQENQHLRHELALRADQSLLVDRLSRENALLKARLKDLEEQLNKPQGPPPFIKPNVTRKRRKRPGREEGHVAALRPVPEKIDRHQDVPLPADAQGKPSCPQCNTQLGGLKEHWRLIEEIIPATPITVCYHTQSGYCPRCRRRIESKAPEQPPAADLPHAQLGLNALATAALLRIGYRLPLRQISRLFEQLPGLKISPAGIAKQIQRLGKWLSRQEERLKLALRASGVVHADETGWRINGRNGYLWTLCNKDHTLYHVDRSRGGAVLKKLLGRGFGGGQGTLISDFYGVYDQMEGSKQKCLAHLLRELSDIAHARPEVAGHEFFRRCRRLIQEMLRLKEKRKELEEQVYSHQVQLLEKRLEKLWSSSWDDADADRLARRLHKHQDSLTTFLHKQEVDGTNNLAERALRPAVVMRKITGGSRSEKGAKAWAILASVLRTAEQQGKDTLQELKRMIKDHWAGEDSTILAEAIINIEAGR